MLDRVAGEPDGLARLRAARAHARARAWAAGLLVVDADATLVLATATPNRGAARTDKGSFGFAPLLAYLDRGAAPGEPLAGMLRPGNAAPVPAATWSSWPWPSAPEPRVTTGSWSAATAPGQHPAGLAPARARGRFTVGMQIDPHLREAILAQPEHAWTPAVDLTARSALAPRCAS